MKTGKLLVKITPFISIFAIFSASAQAARKTLDVGIALRLNDRFNDTVSAMATGIETAKSLYEKTHPGVRIMLHRYPHDEALDSVASTADRIMKERIPAVIGGELSEESYVLRDKLEPQKIVFITPTSSNPKVTEGHPFVFRSCFSDRLVAARLADFTVDRLHAASIGVVHNVSSPYTDFLSKQFIETIQTRNSKNAQSAPLKEEKILRDTKDFDGVIESFVANHVTHVFMPTHQDDLLRFVLQASNKGFFPVYIGSDGWGSNEHLYKKLITESPFGNKFVAYRNSYWKEDAKTPMTVDFRKEYSELYTRTPTAWSAVAFDAAWVLFTAMNQATDPKNGESIRQAMHALNGLPLITSNHFKFGSDNSPLKDLYIYKIDKTGIRYEATLR